MAGVRQNNKYGYIDKKDKVALPMQYDYTWNFYEGLTLVSLDGEIFNIDKSGQRVD